jgi:hypothetical protein
MQNNSFTACNWQNWTKLINTITDVSLRIWQHSQFGKLPCSLLLHI